MGFKLTQAAVNNCNVAPIPMLWRTGAAGGGGAGPDNTCGQLIRQVICGRECKSSEKRGRRANKGVCLCVWRITQSIITGPHTKKCLPISFSLTPVHL